MAETVEQPKVEEFKPADFMEQRNAADAAKRAGKEPEPPKPGKPAEVKPAEAAPIEEDDKDVEHHTPTLPRSVRRELNRLREELGATRGKLEAYQELNKPKESAKASEVAEDPEPERKDFPDDAQYNRALGRWDARQETQKVLKTASESEAQAQERAEWLDGVKAMDLKFAEDVKLIPDFAEVAAKAAKAAEDDPTLRTDFQKRDSGLFGMIMESKVRAFMLHHFCKNPDDLREILALKPGPQSKMFHNLEGKVEVMYTSSHKKQEAAQASASDNGKPKDDTKDRHDPANGDEPGRTAAASETKRQPRPSTEVAARGGSPPPEVPKVGSPAWMAQRNQAQFRH